MYIWSDITNFAESEVRVKQYVRKGRIVRAYTTDRNIEEKKEEPTRLRPENPMAGSLGVPLALVGIAGLAAIVGLSGSKGVGKAIEDKVKVEKAVAQKAIAKSPVLDRVKELPPAKLTQELQDLRALYQSDKSTAMSSFYAGIDPKKPQEAKLKFAQMVAQKEISPEEAGKIVESYEKATSGGVAIGTFKQNVVKKVQTLENNYEKQLVNLKDLQEKITDPNYKGRLPSADKFKYINDSIKKIETQQKLVTYEVYGEEFAKLGSGKTQMEQKQYLFLQEYLGADSNQYKDFKNYILGGSLIQAEKGRSVGFSTATTEEAVRNAYEYGYNSEDIKRFNTVFGMNLRQKGFGKIKNIYK